MTPRLTVLLQVDPKTLGANLWLLFAAFTLLAIALVFLFAVWTGIKTWVAIVRERRARREYFRRFRRADGRCYPPVLHGKCEQCGVQQSQIYHVDGGPSLCPDCYEPYWRRVTGWGNTTEADVG